MALWLLVVGRDTERFEAGTIIGTTEVKPVPLSNKEVAFGMKWVMVSDAMDDAKTIEDSLGRQFVKGVKVPSLLVHGVIDPEKDSKSVLRTALLSAAVATAAPKLNKVT